MGRTVRLIAHTSEHTVHRVRRAVVAISLVVSIGTLGFMLIEGWSLWRSLFFTLVTITTVGYGDYGLSANGEVFTAFILVLGITTVTYPAGQLLRDIIELQNDWERRMDRQISHLRDHYIVCGMGRLGTGLCSELEMAGVAFVVLESDRTVAEEAARRGWLTVVGDATEEESLRRANIEHAAGLACLTNSDADNTVITLAARELRKDMLVIGRAESDEAARRLTRAGASRVISPVRAGGRSIARMIAQPHLTTLLEGSEESSGVRLAEVKICSSSPLAGRPLREFGAEHHDVVFVSLRRAGSDTQSRPGIDETLHVGDVLIAAADIASLGRFALAALPEKQAA
jgi:voltage-gated potassium channel